MVNLRRVPLQGAINVRDLGGYPTKDGHVTPFGRFYRSDNMNGLSQEEMNLLHRLGIRTIVDLRTPGEIAAFPNCMEGQEDITLCNCSLLGEDTRNFTQVGMDANKAAQEGFLRSLGENYGAMLTRDKTVFQHLFSLLAAGIQRGAVLFHCTIGKDRTGVTAALLLALANVWEEDIVADYALTQVYIAKKVQAFMAQHPEADLSTLSALPESMVATLEALEALGGAEQYLLGCGVSLSELSLIWGDSLRPIAPAGFLQECLSFISARPDPNDE